MKNIPCMRDGGKSRNCYFLFFLCFFACFSRGADVQDAEFAPKKRLVCQGDSGTGSMLKQLRGGHPREPASRAPATPQGYRRTWP